MSSPDSNVVRGMRVNPVRQLFAGASTDLGWKIASVAINLISVVLILTALVFKLRVQDRIERLARVSPRFI